jgi:hypothetical protein
VYSDSNRCMTKDNNDRFGSGDPVPDILDQWLAPFRPWFTAPSWTHLLVLVMGAILCPGKRTVTACLRITGRADAANFSLYHQVLNRARWKPRALASRLLSVVVTGFVPDGPSGDRHGRHHRAPMGRPHRRPGHLSRPGTLEPWALRQDQRIALAELHDFVAGSVGQMHQGPASFDASVSFGAI